MGTKASAENGTEDKKMMIKKRKEVTVVTKDRRSGMLQRVGAQSRKQREPEVTQISRRTTIEVKSTVGEADSNIEDIEGPRIDRDTSGRHQEEETDATRMKLAIEVPRDQIRDHIGAEVETGGYTR